MTLFYIPLEPYESRYTWQLSGPNGWWERAFERYDVKARVIRPAISAAEPLAIKTGSVLDAVGRCTYSFAQIAELLRLAEAGEICSTDTIYFDDMWTPGIEALPYAFSQMGLQPRMYAYCHAQTVDRYDFTYPMKEWMRPFEEGIGKILTGVFVGCPTIEELLLTSGIFQPGQVWALGHPFDSAEVRERMPKEKLPRENKVVFSSRWDWEKQPQFFLQVAEQLLETVPHAKFVVCTSHPKLKSNKPELLELLHKYRKKYPENFYLKEGLTKEEYYRELCTAKAQFNSSLQDFISYVLLEASVAGCYPVYPSFRSFPETLLYHMEYMYPPWEVAGAVTLLQYALLAPEACSATNINERAWIHRRFDKSCERILSQMGIINKQIDNPFDFNADKEN